MIKLKKEEKDFANRGEYLIALAIGFLNEQTNLLGDKIFYDGLEGDNYTLANDLMWEFNLSLKDVETEEVEEFN